jgi:hypothetical protein
MSLVDHLVSQPTFDGSPIWTSMTTAKVIKLWLCAVEVMCECYVVFIGLPAQGMMYPQSPFRQKVPFKCILGRCTCTWMELSQIVPIANLVIVLFKI